MQGYGWCTMEETSWGDSEHRWVKPGQLFTRGPGTYKIPSFNDVPSDMRVKLMDRANAFAVHSSKASVSYFFKNVYKRSYSRVELNLYR